MMCAVLCGNGSLIVFRTAVKLAVVFFILFHCEAIAINKLVCVWLHLKFVYKDTT